MVVAGTLPAVGVGLLEEHLDPSTANDLIHDVLSAAAGQTVLLITHRTEGLELVDRVLTLGPGTGAASVDPSAADVK